MAKKTNTKKIGNDVWIRRHFEKIVVKYGGKYPYIFVAKGRVFPIKAGDDIAKIEERITKKYGRPVGMPVPKPEDFTSILFFKI